MKNKHVRIQSDSLILKKIYEEVNNKLRIKSFPTAVLLIFKFMFYVAGVATAYIGIYASDGPFLLLLSYIAFGFFGVLLGFNFAHDFCHSTVFKSKKLNNFAFTVIYALVGAHAEAWKYRHVHSHHYAPNVKDYDTDLQITSLIRVEPSGEYKWFHKFQHFYAPLHTPPIHFIGFS